MGISAYNPSEAAKGPTNAKRAAIERMLREHGFVRLVNVGDGQHTIFRHSLYPDIRTKVTGHKGSDLKAATVEDAGKACLEVLARQEAERQAFSEQALASIKGTALAERILSDQVTAEQIDENLFLLRDAKYPELGIVLNAKSPPAELKSSFDVLANMRADHAKRLSKLEWRGYEVHADGIHPTRLVSASGTADKELPRFDGTDNEPELARLLREAKKNARTVEAQTLAKPLSQLKRRIQRSGLLLTQVDAQIAASAGMKTERHFCLSEPLPSDKGKQDAISILFEGSERVRLPVVISGRMLEALNERIDRYDRDRLGIPAPTLKQNAEAAPDRSVTPDAPSAAPEAASTLPPIQSPNPLGAAEQSFDALYRALKSDGFTVTSAFRDNNYYVELRHPSFSGTTRVAIDDAHPPLTMELVEAQRHIMDSMLELFFKQQLAGGYTEQIEGGTKHLVYSPKYGGQTVIVPAYVPDRSIKAELDQLKKVSRSLMPGICENETRLLVNIGYKKQGGWLKDSGPPSSLSKLALPDTNDPHSVDKFLAGAHERRTLFYGRARDFLAKIGYVQEGDCLILPNPTKGFEPVPIAELGNFNKEMASIEGIARTRRAFYKNVDQSLTTAGYHRKGDLYVSPKGLHPHFTPIKLPAIDERKGEDRFLREYFKLRDHMADYTAAGDALLKALNMRKPIQWVRVRNALQYQWEPDAPIGICPLIEERPSFEGLQQLLAAFEKARSSLPTNVVSSKGVGIQLLPLSMPTILAPANGAAIRRQ